MTEESQPGCRQPLLGSMLGVPLGAVVGFIIGMIDAPVVNRADPLEHEWYPVLAFLILPGFAAILGAKIGLVFGFVCQAPRGKAARWACAGLFLGLILGRAIPAGDSDAARPICHLLLTAVFICCGFFLANGSAGSPSWQTDE